MRIHLEAKGAAMHVLAEKIVEGFVVDVNCGHNPKQTWIDKVTGHVQNYVNDLHKRPNLKVMSTYPSPDNAGLVRLFTEPDTNETAIYLLNRE